MSEIKFPYAVIHVRGGVAYVERQQGVCIAIVDYDNHPDGDVAFYDDVSDTTRQEALDLLGLKDPEPIEEEADEHEA